MEPPRLRKTVKIPMRCARMATPTEIVSAIEKTRQMYHCSLLEDHVCMKIFHLMERTIIKLREICQEWSNTGARFDLNPLRDSIHQLISALQRRRFIIAEEVDESIKDWENALVSMKEIRENKFLATPIHVPGLKTFSVGYRMNP